MFFLIGSFINGDKMYFLSNRISKIEISVEHNMFRRGLKQRNICVHISQHVCKGTSARTEGDWLSSRAFF